MKKRKREREREMKEENGLDTGLLHQVITLVFSRSDPLESNERKKEQETEKEEGSQSENVSSKLIRCLIKSLIITPAARLSAEQRQKRRCGRRRSHQTKLSQFQQFVHSLPQR